MAAVAGDVDQLVRQRGLAHAFDVVDLDAVVVAIPEGAQQPQHEFDAQLGAVGEDFAAVAVRAGESLQALFRFFEDQELNLVIGDHPVGELPARRHLRSEGRFALPG